MMDDPVAQAAATAKLKRLALTTTAMLFRRRLDPRLIAADVAKIALTRSVARIAKVGATPKQRKRALIGAGVAAATAIGLRVLYRNAQEKTVEAPSPDDGTDVKRLA